MKKALLVFFSATPCLSVFSQDSLLKTFKYRIDHYRALNLNIGGSGDISTINMQPNKVTNSSSQGNTDVNYFAIKSSDRILLTTTASLNGRYYGTLFKYSGQENTNRNFQLNTSASVLNKWFTRKNFRELGVEINGAENSAKSNSSNNPGGFVNNRDGRYSISINTGVGKGRLENVTDMQNAIWLNEALTTAGQLSRPLTADELYELGRTVTQANNTRVLDTRRRTIFVLKTVDDYLQRKGLIQKSDVAYFSNLNDILFFAFNNQRLSGTEKYLRFTPGITQSANTQTLDVNQSKNKQTVTNKFLLFSAGIGKYNPVNLMHQNNYGASVVASYYNSDLLQRYTATGGTSSEGKGNSTLKRAGINLFYEHAIYPNTRTAFSLGVQTQGGYQEQNTTSSFFGLVDVSGSLNYFISYRTRFTASVGTRYLRNYYNITPYFYLTPSNFQLYGNVGFAISL